MAQENCVVRVGEIAIGNDRPFMLIAGPCQIESRGHALEVAGALREISDRPGCRDLQIQLRQGEPHQRLGRAGCRHGRGSVDPGGGATSPSVFRC